MPRKQGPKYMLGKDAGLGIVCTSSVFFLFFALESKSTHMLPQYFEVSELTIKPLPELLEQNIFMNLFCHKQGSVERYF